MVAKKKYQGVQKNYTFFFFRFLEIILYRIIFYFKECYLTKITILLSDTPYKQYIYFYNFTRYLYFERK